MPRLLYIGQNPAQGTGSPVIIMRHLRRFAAAGWQVDVLADYGGNYRACLEEGWTVRQLCHRRWWWPPYRATSPGLSWLRLRLLAREAVASSPKPDAILSYLASHSDFSAQLAGHIAHLTATPLHFLVHDDAAAFPASRGREQTLRRRHAKILRSSVACWFVSPELADCYPSVGPRKRLLYPIPEGWEKPAEWRSELSARPKIYYAGHVWPAQLPLLGRIAQQASAAGAELVVLSSDSPGVRTLCEKSGASWQAPFPTNREALAHLAANAAGLIVSYADTVDAMPWSATSYPSKLVEYSHLGLPIAIVAPVDSAAVRWAARENYPYRFDPADLTAFGRWLEGLQSAQVWSDYAATSLRLARTLFDPARIQATLEQGILPILPPRHAVLCPSA